MNSEICSPCIIRCIHLFPRFKNAALIDEIRAKYDCLYSAIEPHITMAFPFISDIDGRDIENELRRICELQTNFDIRTSGLDAQRGEENIISLNISAGYESICDLHYKMHEGILHKFQTEWTIKKIYRPHITVGRFSNNAQLQQVLQELIQGDYEFHARIDRLYIEQIGENQNSIIESIIPFGHFQ